MPNENDRLNIEQQRSKFAFNHKTSSESSNYDAMAKKLPAYIQTNGFVYTMAFLAEKDKGVLQTIYEWHCTAPENKTRLDKLTSLTSREAFLEKLIKDLSDEEIRILTIETLALFTWLRRFVKDDE
ncbi:MAG: type III-B CRISPR module-associated protein Cmr5 [Microscillaceae bacterium]|nr:type III-B CRISPR module-associated protein Cmr5 [Microscillaceae bacterium]